MAAVLRCVRVWVVVAGGAGTVSHMGGHSWLPMWDSPSAPVSGTGTGFGPLPSMERGIGGFVLLSPHRAAPLDCGSSPQ